MLMLSRKTGEKLMIGDDIVICISEVNGNKVKIGIDAPDNVSIDREEVRLSKLLKNKLCLSELNDLI